MAKKEFSYRGKSVDDLKKMDIKEFRLLVPARQRRSLERGFSPMQEKLLVKIRKAKAGSWKKPIKTHCRDMIIVPVMLGTTIHVHTGKKFAAISIQPEMLGMYLGALTFTRTRVSHSAPGIGATKSSSAASVR